MTCNYRQARGIVNDDAVRWTRYATRFTPYAPTCHCESAREDGGRSSVLRTRIFREARRSHPPWVIARSPAMQEDVAI